MSNHHRNCFTIGTLAIVTSILLTAPLLAQGPSDFRYPGSQPSHSWKSKGGNFVFSGRAVERKGEYVSFKTSKSLEITLPLKYLSQQDQEYLNYLAGDGPAPTETPIDNRPAPPGMSPVEEKTDDRVPPDDFFGPPSESDKSTSDTMPADPMGGDPEQTYTQGNLVEVLDDGSWYEGKVMAVRPSNNTYFVSYTKNGIPYSFWLPATALRLRGRATPMSDEPMSGSSNATSTTTKEVTVDSQTPVGYLVGPMKQGDKLRLSYISGKWKAWGRLATESPDSVNIGGGDKCRMAICELRNQEQVITLTLVPAETSSKPFTWTAKQDYENILLQINDSDGDFSGNPPSDVKYSVTIEKSQ